MNSAYNFLFAWGLGAAALMGACATGTDATTDEDDSSTRSTTSGGGDGGDGVGGAQAGPAGPGSGGVGNNPGPGAGGSPDGGGGAGATGGVGSSGGMGGIGAGGMGTGGVANGGNGGSGGSPIVCTPILLDPSFEGGTPNATWTEASTNFGTPLCTTAICGAGGAPLSGSWFYWGGGFVDTLFGGSEVSTVSQTLVIPAGTATLAWRLTMPNCDLGFTVEDYFGIVIDGNVAYVIDTLTEPTCGGTTYAARTIDVSAYADGGSHTIEIVVDQLFDPFFSTDVTNVFVDDVVLTSCQ